jgi:ribonuclease HII
MQTHLHSKVQLVPKHKADLNYIEVAAASILAKVTRDREIIKIKKKYKIEFGSGYPADSRTVKFLKECNGNYPIFRKSWATWKRFIQN